MELSVLEDWLVRVRLLPDGSPRLDSTWTVSAGGDIPPEGRRRDDLSTFSLPGFGVRTGEDSIELKAGELSVSVGLRDPRLAWRDLEGRCFAADLGMRAYPYERGGRNVFHYMERRPDEHYYGFGERAGPLDKRGLRMRMFDVDAMGYDAETGDPLYKHFPFYISFVPEFGIAYGLFYDNLSTTVFDMGRELDAYYGPYRYYQAVDGDVDYYMIFGPTVEQVVERFSWLTGRMVLPPRWSLGYLASTMSYTDSPDAQEQLGRFVDLLEEHRIPCDLFHLSSGYTAGDDGKRYVFNWNRDRIPDPAAMVERFRRSGVRVAANIKPALLHTHPRYEEVSGFDGFVRSEGSEDPELDVFWGGWGSYLDFTNPLTREWWKRMVREQLLDYGIEVTWNDNNEFEVKNDDAWCAGFGEPVSIGHLRPVQTLLMARASYEVQRESRPEERPYLISRSGCPGIQRYAQTWSGDNNTSWRSLRYNIPMGLGLSLSGAPNTGHDVGGFAGERPDPELFVRWVQNGIFHPRFTIHSWNPGGSANEPWMYPEVLPIIRDTIEFRYRLIPYLYTLMFEAARTGHPVIRPLVYAFPNDPRCHTESFDFLLGPNLLVASVLEPGARTREVYLPTGRMWCDFHTGEWHEGGQTIEADAPLERTVLFVPDGGMIPMGQPMRHVGERPDDLRQVHVFPHPRGGTASYQWTEDDGASLACSRGVYTTVALEVSSDGDFIELHAPSPRGDYHLTYEELDIILPAGEKRPVSDSLGPRREWEDDRGRRHLAIRPGQRRRAE
jgi:alpha-glucosidase